MTCFHLIKCFISIISIIKLHAHTHYTEILEKVKYKTHTYHGFSYNVKEKYLGTYKYECSNLICNKCNTSFTYDGIIN